MEVWCWDHSWKESGMYQIREGMLVMETKQEAVLCPLNKQVGVETPGEETEYMIQELVGDSAGSKHHRGAQAAAWMMPREFPSNNSRASQASLSPFFLAQLTKPCESCPGFSHLFLASCLQLPKMRADERWNYLSEFHCRLGQLRSLIGKSLEFRLSLESHQEVDYSYRGFTATEKRIIATEPTPAPWAETAGFKAMANRGLPSRWAVKHSPRGPCPFSESREPLMPFLLLATSPWRHGLQPPSSGLFVWETRVGGLVLMFGVCRSVHLCQTRCNKVNPSLTKKWYLSSSKNLQTKFNAIWNVKYLGKSHQTYMSGPVLGIFCRTVLCNDDHNPMRPALWSSLFTDEKTEAEQG